jgi:FAD/FMN-containing dehydrogenase
VTDYQVTYWRDLPSMVAARQGDATTTAQLAPRFQEAIDEAAMRLGDTGSDDYLAGWRRSEWTSDEAAPDEVLGRVVAELDAAWPADKVAGYLDALGDPA